MGRPYERELSELPRTYAWASRLPVGALAGFVGRCSKAPMYAVGSGGSFTSATFASALHEQGGSMSKAVTPLEFVWNAGPGKAASAIMFTAGGNNKDILASFARAPPGRTGIVCTSTKNKLVRRASAVGTFVHAARPPSGRDGFLATNSLLATMVWLARAYSEALSLPYEVPRLERLAGPASDGFEGARGARTLLVLHDDWGKAAAIDAESKMSEAGLAGVQVSDYRSFAHGRHNWLDKAERTCVAAMITPRCARLADRTLDLLPGDIPVVRMETGLDGPPATIDLTLQVFRLVGFFGAERGIDPGRPGVADFGRRIYGLGMPGAWAGPSGLEGLVLRRKFGSTGGSDTKARARQRALHGFVGRMARQRFGAVIFDYDGTLCDEARKSDGPSAGIGRMLSGLARRGVAVGVATGRGDSVREQLRELLPKRHHAGVLVGYHNGAEIGSLSDLGAPDPGAPANKALHSAFEALVREGFLSGSPSVGPMQISLRSPRPGAADLRRLAERLEGTRVRVVESGHSVDLLAPGVSKLALFRRMRGLVQAGRRILCIGDRGRRPGNDYELLGTAHSLSVDEASEDASRCWNLLPPGVRGEAGVLHYMGWFGVHDGFVALEKYPDVLRGAGGRAR